MLFPDLMAEIASDEVLEQAYLWLCDRRKGYSPNNDVWTLRWRWREVKLQVQQALLLGCYRFAAVERFNTGKDTLEIWSSQDALVLKAVAIVLARNLSPHLSKTCHHLAGNGGAKAAVRRLCEEIPSNTFVFRSDVKRYYASIDHEILFAQLKQHIADARLLDLLWQYLRRTIYDGGRYETMKLGIPLGCSLSPLMGALYLKPLDERMAATGLFYARFMDDWVVLAATRWKLRAAVWCVNQTLAELKLRPHPDKTFVGRICRGFDFLGYRLAAAGIVGVAKATAENCVERMNQLYEQGADIVRIGDYVRRWWQWVRSGLGGCRPSSLCPPPPQINEPKSQQGRSQERERGGFGHGPAHLASDRERTDIPTPGVQVEVADRVGGIDRTLKVDVVDFIGGRQVRAACGRNVWVTRRGRQD